MTAFEVFRTSSKIPLLGVLTFLKEDNFIQLDMKNNKQSDCCQKIDKKESQAFGSGIVYGLIPHIGCIAFIVFTVLGVTTAVSFFKPILLNPYFFYILVGLSFIFATVSAAIYLNRNGLFSISGIKRKWKYLSTLYGSTIVINILIFLVIFPFATNFISNRAAVNKLLATQGSQTTINIQVSIPCPGHAPLITEELNKIDGVNKIEFKFPNTFVIHCDFSKTSKEKILASDIFDTYKATAVNTQ